MTAVQGSWMMQVVTVCGHKHSMYCTTAEVYIYALLYVHKVHVSTVTLSHVIISIFPSLTPSTLFNGNVGEQLLGVRLSGVWDKVRDDPSSGKHICLQRGLVRFLSLLFFSLHQPNHNSLSLSRPGCPI